MSDLIDRQAAIEAVRNMWGIVSPISDDVLLIDKAQAETELMMLPTAEPRKGSWVCEIRHYKDTAGEFDYQYIYCSECGEQRRIGWRDANYCPNCGARMEADNDLR